MQHDPFAADQLVVDQRPAGQIYAFGATKNPKGGLLRLSQRDAAGWSSTDIHWDASEAIATTGGADPTTLAYSHADQVLRVYRSHETSFYSADHLTVERPSRHGTLE